ncbi:MAG: peptidylprolyl isomerase [Elusimicrobia bacterium]|nr:peptidylprolyl isomerase [Elusimicrobiota bacterium]
MRSSNSLLLSAALALSVPAGAAVLEDVVARVNGKPLLLSEYKKNLRSVIDNYQKAMPELTKEPAAMKELRGKVLDQMVDDEVLAQEAEKKAIKVSAREVERGINEVQERSFRTDPETGERREDKAVEAALKLELDGEGMTWDQFSERIKRQILIRKTVELELQARMKEADEKRIKSTFETFKTIVSGSTDSLKGLPENESSAWGAFAMRLRDTHSERVRVSHVLVKVSAGAAMTEKTKALDKAKALKKKLDDGADFYEVAKDNSDDQESAARGGDMGWILRGWMPENFEKTAFSLGVGETSEPVESDFGYHLVRVQEKKAKETLNLEKLKMPIKEFLYNLDYQKELVAFVKRIRERSTIEVKLPPE